MRVYMLFGLINYADQHIISSTNQALKPAQHMYIAATLHIEKKPHTSQKVLNNTTKAFTEDLKSLSCYCITEFQFQNRLKMDFF